MEAPREFSRHMAYLGNRLKSFRGWPQDSPAKSTDLAEAGFVYAGHGDVCVCFQCGGKLHNWKYGDAPIDEHRRWYPNCLYARNLITNGDLFRSAAAQTCVEYGFPEKMIRRAIEIFIATNGRSDFHTTDLYEVLVQIKENKFPPFALSESRYVSEDTTTQLAEYRQLKQDRICKYCCDDVARILFLPCGHLVSCADCAKCFSRCPYDDQLITGIVKTYFG